MKNKSILLLLIISIIVAVLVDFAINKTLLVNAQIMLITFFGFLIASLQLQILRKK